MKGTIAVLGQIADVQIAAKVVDGVLDDLLVTDPAPYAVGTILRGIADRPMKGMGGIMIRLPEGTAYLRKPKGVVPGQSVTIQVTGTAEAGKAPPVTQRILFKSKYVIITPDAPGLNISRRIKDDDRRDELTVMAKAGMDESPLGMIMRSQCQNAPDEEILSDIDVMRDMAEAVLADTGSEPEILVEGDDPHQLAWREWSDVTEVHHGDEDLEHFGVVQAIEEVLESRAVVKDAVIFVEPTRALVAVDVNTTDISPAGAMKANLATIKALPRLLRLKGLGGQITIDFAPMTKRDRKPAEVALRAACKSCPVDMEFVGWTPLGHAELKRKRERIDVGAVLKEHL